MALPAKLASGISFLDWLRVSKGSHHKKKWKNLGKVPNRLDPPPPLGSNSDIFDFRHLKRRA